LTRHTDNAIEAHGQHEYLGSPPPCSLFSESILDNLDSCSLLNPPGISNHFTHLYLNPLESFANPSTVRGDDINYISSSTKAVSTDSVSIVSGDDFSHSSGDGSDSYLADLFSCSGLENDVQVVKVWRRYDMKLQSALYVKTK